MWKRGRKEVGISCAAGWLVDREGENSIVVCDVKSSKSLGVERKKKPHLCAAKTVDPLR